MKYLFSSESITEGHPDKVCDGISDAILDACLAQDPDSRVAVETLVTTEFVCIAGEVTTKANVDYEAIARKKIADIGYTVDGIGFNDKSEIKVLIHEQSPDISQGVTVGKGEYEEQGAGDQGIMFGYATNETPNLMPMPIDLAHKLSAKLTEVRKKGIIKELLPDGKSQVSVEYVDGVPVRVTSVVIASHHYDTDMPTLRKNIKEKVIDPIVGNMIDENTTILINATGKFVVGGPHGDAGLTGRKIIVDTYGGMGRHGGGAFSGKDPSKVDRSAAYAARYIAKNIVAAGLADKCEVQLAYCIGYATPLSIFVDCKDTEKISLELMEELIRKHFPLKPAQIISELQLKQPIYHKTSAYGHFGKTDLPWEQTDKVEILKKEAGI
ncbi:MAG: methionine adenosyltransferase [archaeon]|jgi:S-adenosylmethionine synthetase